MRINPGFKIEMTNMVNNKRVNLTTKHNMVAKFIIQLLAENNVSFRVINLGAGVKRVTTDVDICPKCNGTGRC